MYRGMFIATKYIVLNHRIEVPPVSMLTYHVESERLVPTYLHLSLFFVPLSSFYSSIYCITMFLLTQYS